MHRTLSGNGDSRGLTLIEFVVIIAVITVLLGFGCHPFFSSSRAKACRAKCASNLSQIFMACMLYSQEERIFPYADENSSAHEHLQLLVDTGFIDDPGKFICPSSKTERPAQADTERRFKLSAATCSYAYTKEMRSPSSRSTMRLAADKKMYHVDGLNLVFVGGNVEYVRAREDQRWEELTKGQLTR